MSSVLFASIVEIGAGSSLSLASCNCYAQHEYHRGAHFNTKCCHLPSPNSLTFPHFPTPRSSKTPSRVYLPSRGTKQSDQLY